MNCFCKFYQLLPWKSPSRLFMSSKSDPGVLEDRWFLRPLKLLSICSKMYSDLFLQVSSSFAQKKSIKTLYVLKVWPWSLGGQMIPETTKIAFNMFKNVFWPVSANFIKFCPEKVHQDSLCPRSLNLESWMTGWLLIPYKCICSLCWKFHLILTSITLSRLHLSSKCHPGVLEDRMVPDTIVDDFNNLRNVFEAYVESFSQFWQV